jgi:hypothetical protein
MKADISLPDLDFGYKLLKNQILFSERELQLYRIRLLSLQSNQQLRASRVGDIRSMVRNFRRLRSEILVQEEAMAFYSRDYPIDRNHEHYPVYCALRNSLEKLMALKSRLLEEIGKEFKGCSMQ